MRERKWRERERKWLDVARIYLHIKKAVKQGNFFKSQLIKSRTNDL